MDMQFSRLKSLFLKSLIGCLIAAATLAVSTILVGHFGEISSKALVTIFLIAVHCLISFGFIVNNEKQETFENLAIFANATFLIIVLSFATSVLGVWGVLPGEFVGRLYALYGVLLFATLHGEVLARTVGKQANIDKVVYTNYMFMSVVVIMLLPIIFLHDSAGTLGPFYFRLLAACGVVDATLTLVAIIMHKLYIQKHPKINDNVFNLPPGQGGVPAGTQAQQTAAAPRRGTNIFVVVLIGFIVLQIIGSIFAALVSFASK